MLNAVSGFRNREAKLFEEAETAEDKIYSWFRSTETGIMEELEHKLLRTSFAANIRSDKDTCLKQRCPHIGKCFYYNAIQKAKNSRLIVTNHALLFIDSYIRAAGDEGFDESVIIPPYNRLIIDECHNIDKSATEFFSLSLCEERVRESYRKLFSITYKNRNNMHLADIITTYKKEITADDARAFNVNLTQFTSEVCIYLKTLVSARDRQLFVSECLVTDTQENFDAVRKGEAAQLLITLDEILRKSRRIDHHKRFVAPVAGTLQRPREQLLAGSGSAPDEHCRTAGGDLPDHRIHFPHRLAVADDLRRAGNPVELFAEAGVLLNQP